MVRRPIVVRLYVIFGVDCNPRVHNVYVLSSFLTVKSNMYIVYINVMVNIIQSFIDNEYIWLRR